LTARLVELMGYPAVYLSGSLQHAMRGYADINALTMSEMVQTSENVAHEIAIPCIADAETGFGIGINVTRTVRSFERAGVAAIHIEDSTVPKRPARLGFESPTVSKTEFLDKIKTALNENNAAVAKAATHKIKTNVAMLGMRDPVGFMNEMHLLSTQEDVSDKVKELYIGFETEIFRGLSDIENDFFKSN